MKDKQRNENYLKLKAPGRCIADEAVKVLKGANTEFVDKFLPPDAPHLSFKDGAAPVRELIASDTQGIEDRIAHVKKVNAQSRKDHRPPASKCVF
jgi:hypothetical protein